MASGSSEAGGFTCCVPGCYNNSKKHKGKFSFYNFPGDQNLRRQWLHNISRKDFRPTTRHRVCSAHFEGGSKTYQNNVPTVFPLQKSHPKVIKTPRRLLVRHKEEEIQEETEENKPTCPEENQIDSTNHCNNEPSLEDQIIELRQQIAALESRNSKLECELRFGLEKFKSSDDDMQYYTGMENYAQFKALYDFLDGGVNACSRLNYWGSNNSNLQLDSLEKRGKKRTLLPIDELFLTMARLRVNIPEKVLSDWYKISVSEVSRIFITWVNFMFTRFMQLPIWASKKTVEKTMPDCFKFDYPFTRTRSYYNSLKITVRVILDCTEIFIEKPSCFRAQSATYKSHNTAKGLVEISPQGAVTFVSDLFGGHASDRQIVVSSGILDLLEPGDSVIAHRGFEIQDLLVSKKASLNIAPFMRCKDQLDPDEEDETRQIASVPFT
ncbi:unnamed protein product [Porites lobata]|uniref:THAP-type domain-containing protein n=1 Tax=Porites lobata TaxID=104759 RepID=A0ABN8NUH5_9CNID|nr:unnamed protein product [Porites lobata]